MTDTERLLSSLELAQTHLLKVRREMEIAAEIADEAEGEALAASPLIESEVALLDDLDHRIGKIIRGLR